MADQMVPLDVGEGTNIGRRERNEDYHRTWRSPDDALRGGRLFLVADGVGGETMGDVASKTVVESVGKLYYQYMQQPSGSDAHELLKYAIEQANRELYEYATSQFMQGHIATTLVAALMTENKWTIAWVGDSRAYLLKKDDPDILQITEDHSRQENVLSRSLGSQPSVTVDLLVSKDLSAGDQVLLCSDGLTKFVSPAEIQIELQRATTSQQAVNALIQMALERGGSDNITVINVYVGKRQEKTHAPTILIGEQPVARETLAQPVTVTSNQKRSRNSVVFGSMLVLIVLVFAGAYFLMSDDPETPPGTLVVVSETGNLENTQEATNVELTSLTEPSSVAPEIVESAIVTVEVLVTNTVPPTATATVIQTATIAETPTEPELPTNTPIPPLYSDGQILYVIEYGCQRETSNSSELPDRCMEVGTSVRVQSIVHDGTRYHSYPRDTNSPTLYSVSVPSLGYGAGWFESYKLSPNSPLLEEEPELQEDIEVGQETEESEEP